MLYVRGKEITRNEDPSELWAQAKNSTRIPDFVGEWVDSPVVMEDSIRRAKEALDDSNLEMRYTVLEFNRDEKSVVWEICFRSDTVGCEYFYDATDGSFIRAEFVRYIVLD